MNPFTFGVIVQSILYYVMTFTLLYKEYTMLRNICHV